jgi:hypothetical protein
MMTKNETIEAICRLNPTANPEFLSEFAPDDLAGYLRRLSEIPGAAYPFTAADAWEGVADELPLPATATARAPTE